MQEDAHVAILNFDGHSDRALFGVFDGHSGSAVAKFCAKYFPTLLLASEEYKAGDFEGAFKSIYVEMDEMLKRREHAEELQRMAEKKQDADSDESSAFQFVEPDADYCGPDSGCTAVMALVAGNDLYVANAGDSRCVLCHASETKAMTEDHKPENPAERERIQRAGGFVADNRVNGNLAMSRAIGDLYLKKGAGSPEEQLVVATPEVRSTSLDESSQFLILACDGIWDMLTNEQAVHFVEQLALQGRSPKAICEALCDRCLSPTTATMGKGCDNMSAIVVILQRPNAEVAVNQAVQQTSVAQLTTAAGTSPPGPQLPGEAGGIGETVGGALGPQTPEVQGQGQLGSASTPAPQAQLHLKVSAGRRSHAAVSCARACWTVPARSGAVSFM